MHVKLEGPVKSSENDDLRSSFSLPVPFPIPGASRCRVKVMNHESPVGDEVEEVAYEGEDEHDENLSLKRDNSDFDLQAHIGNSNHQNDHHSDDKGKSPTFDIGLNDQYEKISSKDVEESLEMAKSGHISDPGTGKAEFWASPKLIRSCSDLGMRDMIKNIPHTLPPTKSQSFEELQKLAERMTEEMQMDVGSPLSAITHRSADKVMLKKHSSSQILPSRSRKLWWKLFLWSHRNLHRSEVSRPLPILMNPALNQQGGYSSDTLEPRRIIESSEVSPNSFTGESFKNSNFEYDNQSWDGFHGTSGLWPQNQWVALPVESPKMTRIHEWVKEQSIQPPSLDEKDVNSEANIDFPPSPEASRSQTTISSHLNRNIPEEIAHANSVIQSLNSSSTVAHIVGNGLKVVPHLWRFSSLRSVNLSGNFIGIQSHSSSNIFLKSNFYFNMLIFPPVDNWKEFHGDIKSFFPFAVHITPGSLPKGLHTLNLSRNKITTIEGLRELTRLRVLDLSYNRISRIGQGEYLHLVR